MPYRPIGPNRLIVLIVLFSQGIIFNTRAAVGAAVGGVEIKKIGAPERKLPKREETTKTTKREQRRQRRQGQQRNTGITFFSLWSLWSLWSLLSLLLTK